VEDSDSYAPDALRVSFKQAVPDLKRAGQAAIARLQILAHIRAGTIVWRGDEPGKNTD
jgi:cytochrome c-type biogenesis protein CcmE